MTDKHSCSVPGCPAQTTRYSNWICTRHWRMCCPPRSPQRCVYLRFFRQAKKLGLSNHDRWPPTLERRFWRFWEGLIRRAQRIERDGRIDMTEINQMFGWGE